MQTRIFIILLWLFGSSLVAYGRDEASNLPANLTIPEGNTVFLTLIGDGEQIYRCAENNETGGTYQWVFVEPQADLVNEAYERLGIHYAGPSWEANDGSIVRAQVIERADAPNQAIPWLLLQAVSVSGNGLFSHVTYIQRIDTFEGVAPDAEFCTEERSGSFSRVPYRALYRFYTDAPVNLTPLHIADSLQVPTGNQISHQTYAKGVQIYRCQESAQTAGEFNWVFVGPEAQLLNEVNEQIGIHYSGPTWESNDGSLVVSEVLERADSPDGAIPWLLLRVKAAQGNGVLGDTSFIQRLDTVGGTTPAADTCSAARDQQLSRVPYSALYVFYSPE